MIFLENSGCVHSKNKVEISSVANTIEENGVCVSQNLEKSGEKHHLWLTHPGKMALVLAEILGNQARTAVRG